MDIPTLAFALAISTLIVGISLVAGIRIGLNTADEGYLQFGAVSLMDGLVPIRDFRAYDPGRYYWCALWMKAFGRTFTAQRLAMAFVSVLTLTLICGWTFYLGQSWLVATLAALTTFLWIHPYFKVFEILFSLVAVTACFFLIQAPVPATYFLVGVSLGLALFFGLNIALYLGLSLVLVFGFSVFLLPTEVSAAALMWFVPGLFLGLLPTILIAALNPGYLKAYWQKKVMTIINRGATNLPLQLLWIWNSPHQLAGLSPGRQLFFKSVFTGLPVLYTLSILLVLLPIELETSVRNLLLSGSLAGLVYLHHLYSRSDVAHLCNTIHPALLLVFGLSAALLPWLMTVLLLSSLLGLSAWAILPQFSQAYRFVRRRGDFKRFDSGRESFLLPTDQARDLEVFKELIESHSEVNESIFVVPTAPGYYPLYQRQPALYDVYCLYPETAENQAAMVKSLDEQKVRLAIVFNTPTDRKAELIFSRRHELVWHYLNSEFGMLKDERLPDNVYLFVKE